MAVENHKKIKILVLGASGMLGNAVLRVLAESSSFETVGTVRSIQSASLLPEALRSLLIDNIDVENPDSLIGLFGQIKPDLVINCIGVVKQLSAATDPLAVIPINSILPHRIARLCLASGARMIHLSTDCVFSGARGMYLESDYADAKDLYGRSKFSGEVDYPNAITLRTSIIGHELSGSRSLIDWFLSQKNMVRGYKRAIFSGLPTVEIARLIRDYVIPRPDLHGVYHVSADPINKFDLLTLVAGIYNKDISVIPDETLVIDRSLDSTRFRSETGYKPAPWIELIKRMHHFS